MDNSIYEWIFLVCAPIGVAIVLIGIGAVFLRLACRAVKIDPPSPDRAGIIVFSIAENSGSKYRHYRAGMGRHGTGFPCSDT